MEDQIREKKEKSNKASFTLGFFIGISSLSLLGLIVLGIFTANILKSIPKGISPTLPQETNLQKEIPKQIKKTSSFKELAEELGLNLEKFNNCLASEKYLDQISKDKEEANTLGIEGTPYFFINDQELDGAYPFSKFKEIIDQELLKKENKLKQGITLGNHPIQGNEKAKVTIFEFSDYQCPYCQKAQQTLKQVIKEYKDEVRVVFRDFPLETIHSLANQAAQATYCAQEQGKFWQMHDLLFEKQSEWSE